MPRSNETVLEGAFAGTEVILEAAATTFVRIGGGCVTEQQLTSEMSSGFVGSRISLSGIGTGLGFDLRTSALSAEWSSPPLPPNGPVAGAGADEGGAPRRSGRQCDRAVGCPWYACDECGGCARVAVVPAPHHTLASAAGVGWAGQRSALA